MLGWLRHHPWAIGWAVTIALMIGLGSWIGADVIRHNRAVSAFAAQLLDHPLPPDSQVVDHGTRFGILVGNGNHCDLGAWIELSTALTPEQVAVHYSDLNVTAVIETRRSDTGNVLVEAVQFAGGNPIGWDIRCQ